MESSSSSTALWFSGNGLDPHFQGQWQRCCKGAYPSTFLRWRKENFRPLACKQWGAGVLGTLCAIPILLSPLQAAGATLSQSPAWRD